MDESGLLLERGYGVLSSGGLPGWLEGDAARGLELLEGQGTGTVELSAGRAVQVADVRLLWMPQVENGRIAGAELICRLTARLEEGAFDPTDRELKQAEGELSAWGSRCARAALDGLRGMGADCLSLERKLAALRPLAGDTRGRFAGWELAVETRANVTRGE